MARSGIRRVRDKDAKQRALLDAAAEVFSEFGYEGAFTKEIARRAGCSEALIFRYFGDKQGIFERVVARDSSAATQRGEARLSVQYPDRFSEYIEDLFEVRMPRGRDDGRVKQWDTAARALTDEEFARRIIAPVHNERIDIITAGIRRYQELGQVSAEIDPEVLAEIVGNLANITVILGPRMFGTPRRAVRKAIRLAAKVLAAGARPAST